MDGLCPLSSRPGLEPVGHHVPHAQASPHCAKLIACLALCSVVLGQDFQRLTLEAATAGVQQGGCPLSCQQSRGLTLQGLWLGQK